MIKCTTKNLVLAKFEALITKLLTKICEMYRFLIVLFLLVQLYKTCEYV